MLLVPRRVNTAAHGKAVKAVAHTVNWALIPLKDSVATISGEETLSGEETFTRPNDLGSEVY